MIKAVFFDFFNTLVHYQPSREQMYVDACAKYNIQVELKAIALSLPNADTFWRDENRHNTVEKRNDEEKYSFYSEYFTRVLNGAGIKVSKELIFTIFAKMRQMNWDFYTFDDSLTTMKLLKDRSLILGLISNVGQNMEKTFNDLGLQPYLDFNVTSFEVGCEKPQPEIFQAALHKSRLNPEEAVYVGDQYELDVIGSRNLGMKAILLDRNNWFPQITDCPRIRSLTEITQHI